MKQYKIVYTKQNELGSFTAIKSAKNKKEAVDKILWETTSNRDPILKIVSVTEMNLLT